MKERKERQKKHALTNCGFRRADTRKRGSPLLLSCIFKIKDKYNLLITIPLQHL